MADLTWITGKKRPTVLKQLGESLKKKPRLAVTCGNKEGTLYKDKFKKSEPCIWSNHKWFTPTEFEKFGGKEKNKKWKISILHNQIPLQTFIQDGFLPSPSFKTKRSQDKEPKGRRELIRSRRSTSSDRNGHAYESDSFSELSSLSSCSDGDDDDDDGDDGDDVQVTDGGDSFDITCSTGRGVLYVTRFATETCGKCIRTQDAWLTPEDFLNKNKPGGNWRLDIRSRGVPLGKLIMRRVLKPHALNCKCPICTGDRLHLLDQNNDDVCFKCNRDGDLVCCDKCPRAFHHHCHKPALRDDTIGDNWTCSFCKKSVPGARN
ncbi:hypothetical protein PDJAM_G00177010 [Pangasius djambal]|uniref:Uncharacterized protein n=1 Tax=Pangasius djambal TaxID=1691987 RepID=A0ACC5ZP01_9TELE|nr:hypothetical protein [Pangasius djambal]